MLSSIFVLLLAAESAAGPAPPPKAPKVQMRFVQPGESVAPGPGEQRFTVICRREDLPNTRFTRRVCRTPENLEKMGDEASAQVREMARQASFQR